MEKVFDMVTGFFGIMTALFLGLLLLPIVFILWGLVKIGGGLLFLLYVGQFIGLTWSIKITVFLISNIYTIWILVSIWNCAYNVKKKIWGDLSRVIVVLNIILLFLIYTGILSIDYQNIV